MKTLLLLVEDDYAESLKGQLPADKAWILPERYDAFRCGVREAMEAYVRENAVFAELNETIKHLNRWMEEEGS